MRVSATSSSERVERTRTEAGCEPDWHTQTSIVSASSSWFSLPASSRIHTVPSGALRCFRGLYVWGTCFLTILPLDKTLRSASMKLTTDVPTSSEVSNGQQLLTGRACWNRSTTKIMCVACKHRFRDLILFVINRLRRMRRAAGLDPGPAIVVEVFEGTCARPIPSERAFKEDAD